MKRLVGTIASITLLAALAGTSSTRAASPWWHLAFEGRPASVRPGSAEDAVQEVKVSGTEGSFLLKSQEVYREMKGVENNIYFSFDASHPLSDQVMREGLEGMWGAGTVEVTGGQGDATGSKSYVIKFIGSRGDQPVEQMNAEIVEVRNEGHEGSVNVTYLSEGRSDGEIVVNASNLGEEDVHGENTPVAIADKLPPGLTAIKTEAFRGTGGLPTSNVGCIEPAGPCTWNETVAPYNGIEMVTFVKTTANMKAGEVNEAQVEGGEAPDAALREPVSMSDAPVQFSVQKYEVKAEEAGGAPDTQAGSHPFQLTTTLSLNQEPNPLKAPALVKDLIFQLPPGLIGNPTPFPQCSDVDFAMIGGDGENSCLANTALGVAAVKIAFNVFGTNVKTVVVPVFNLKPSVGEPARFGFEVQGVNVFLDTSVRTGGDYGVTVSVKNISQEAVLLGSQVTFWGVPGDPRHDGARGWSCIDDSDYSEGGRPCGPLGETAPPPFLSLPTSCTGPLQSSVQSASWTQPGVLVSSSTSQPMLALDGCNRLPFSPSITVAPDGQQGSTPTGLTVGIHVPQALVLDPTALAESNVKSTTVALPEGVTLNPAAADGLESCTEGQVALEVHSAPLCPEASKVGTVTISSPLLPNALEGAVYLAAQNENPFGSLVALYLVAQDPMSGTLVKVAGEVKPDPVTGQLVSTFDDTPQLPFEDLELHFFGGDRAPLATPASCGTYTTSTSIEPWSENPPSTPSSSFRITSGPNGSPCASPLPFAPSLTAGTTSIQAGGFSPFTMTMSRDDGNQNLQAIQLHLPPGLSGLLSSVKLCGEPQADQGTCGPESEIGETIVSVGLGGNPFSVKGGKVFVTGSYEGAPYGLSIVNPAKAGPYDLEKGTPCDCVVVRAKIEVDPITAALTITSDDSGSYKIPTILDGIPLQIKHVNVLIDRPAFTFNPTSCNPMQITGTLSSVEGARSALSVPLQVTNCAVLGFKPVFSVSTAGRTSRAQGASLHVKLSYPKGPFGSQANISKVKVDLPKQLPSRLTTLQKACPDSTFNKNPALCLPQSRIGEAKATTPLLPVPLSGPVYFVSHGGAKFPELVIVLSGYGTTIELHAETFISSAGITSSTFRTVPDAPVGTFELTLPQGKYSALAANGNLCQSKLKMPTAFTAQNGAVIKQSTPITVTGCSKHKKVKKATKHKKKK